MIAKDFYCPECDEELLDVKVDSTSTSTHFHWCDGCEQMRTFRVLCNGGARGRRWRYVDWNEDAINATTRYHGVKTDSDDGKGGKVHDSPHFSPDAVDERRKRLKHSRDKQRGKGKLVFNG